MPTELRNFLAIPYDELEEMNLSAKEQRQNRVATHKIQEERLEYLSEEKRIKAVTVLFSDLEGRLHMLDYDKKFLIKSWDNLTFDGSSIRGFTAQRESDLRLGIDWGAFYWGPADVFGPGKVLVFGDVIDKGGTPYSADIRGILKTYAEGLNKKHGYTLNAANEIEGFLFQGPDAERRYHETGKFEYVNTGGYYHSLPGDVLRTFIDTTAEVQRSMELWVGCIAGALKDSDYTGKLARAGFDSIDIEPTRVYSIEDARQFLSGEGIDVDAIAPQVEGKFMSAFIRAAKPSEKGCCGPACCS